MTTGPTQLQERIARELVLSPYVRGQLSKIGSVMKRREAERIALAAAVLPLIAAEVRKAKAEALREIAPHLNDSGDESFLMDAADRIETGETDERR